MLLRSCKWIFLYFHISTIKLPFIDKSIMIYAYKDILKHIKANWFIGIYQVVYILIIGSMLKRVHKQTALSLHKNTTKLTSIDTQVQISEYIGGLNLPSNAVCYTEIRIWYPYAVMKVDRDFKRLTSVGRRISSLVQSDFRHMQTGGRGIWQFRKFFVSLMWHSWKHPRPDVLSYWKSVSTWMSKVCFLIGETNTT